MESCYLPDLACVHDTGFSEFALRSAPGILRHLSDAQLRDGLVVDLGCGSGLLAEKLLEAGYDVLGIDLSAAMLEIARRRAPRGRFVEGSFLIDFFVLLSPSCFLGALRVFVVNAYFGTDHFGRNSPHTWLKGR